MEINKTNEAGTLVIEPVGRLDSSTAPELEAAIDLDNVQNVIMNFDKLEYLSSAGLRVIMLVQKKICKTGKLTIKNVNEDIMEVFDITGFSDILNIE